MYWCKGKFQGLKTILGAVLLLSALQSCNPGAVRSGTAMKYFDIAGYFKADTARLMKNNPLVNKTVTYNGGIENKIVHIGNWGQELNLFIQSDINRPAWRNSYSVLNTDSLIIYKANTRDLRTTEILIKKVKGKVKYILIFNQTKNLLYETKEKLSYFPDSVYQIEKSQSIKLMGKNLYRIKGIMVSNSK